MTLVARQRGCSQNLRNVGAAQWTALPTSGGSIVTNIDGIDTNVEYVRFNVSTALTTQSRLSQLDLPIR